MKGVFFTILIIFSSFPFIIAQTDSLVFTNGNYMVGEIKGMDRSVLTIETDYSKKDFAIEWDGVKEIYAETFFLITLSNGSRYNGYIKSDSTGDFIINTDDGRIINVNIMDIVILDDRDKGFWSQLYASIDVGLDLTKANDFRQVSMRSTMGYMAKRWLLQSYFNTLNSTQVETDDIRRTEGGLTYRYFLPRDWYPLASIDFLTNTEQKLKLRTTAKLGMGKFVIHTNKTYWGFTMGANYNNETSLVDTVPKRKSWEGFLGSELNLFNIGDLSMLTSATAYPSFTESGRWRLDFTFDFKYDLPLDFYIKLGTTVNYDNQPVSGTSKSDYVFHTGFGWEW